MSLCLWVEPGSQRNRKASMGTNGNTGNTFLRLDPSSPRSSSFRALATVRNYHKINVLISYMKVRDFAGLADCVLQR